MRPAFIAAAVLGVACAGARQGAAPPEQSKGIAFIHDDLEGALAKANAEGKPLFVDAWAPW